MVSKSGAESIVTTKEPLQPRGMAGWDIGTVARPKGATFWGARDAFGGGVNARGRRQLMLVRCGGERFLVGCSTESTETIIRISAVSETAGEAYWMGEQS